MKKALLVLVAGLVAMTAHAALAAASSPTPVTPQLIEAARKEGKVVYYTAIDLKVAQSLVKNFEKLYPGISVLFERTGSERIFQRVAQEHASNIFAVDVLDGSDQSMFITWKAQGVLEPFIPTEVLKWPAAERDADGAYQSVRVTLMPIAYNTKLVKLEDAPKSFADLLDPKWTGKMVKAHPSNSGGIVTSTFQTVRELGWDYLQKLGKQKEGIATKAPHPNAAKLFMSFMVSRETQQFPVDEGGLRLFHPEVTDKAGRVPLSKIKLFKSDPAAQEKLTDEIKKKYTEYFGI